MAKQPAETTVEEKEYVVTFSIDNEKKSVIVKAESVNMAVYLASKKIKLAPSTIIVKSL